MKDPYRLQRFVDAQNSVYREVCSELRRGGKEGHWMWFVFPQLEGLGHSDTAKEFSISSIDEAAAYLTHPILGPRLLECTRLVNAIEGRSVHQIFGYPDDLKFYSSMTLFSHATSDNGIFMAALQKYCRGEFDSVTIKLLHRKSEVSEP
jgi:uncharacterized protein (DUF1810 family)